MKFRTLVYLGLLSFLLITGCSTVEQEVKTTKNDLDSAPNWLNYTSSATELVVIQKAYVTDGNFTVQRNLAIKNSKTKLEQKLTQNLTDIFKLLSNNVVNYNEELYLSQSQVSVRSITAHAVEKSKIITLWESPNHTIYVQRVISIKELEETLDKTIQSRLSDFNFVYDKYTLAKEQGQIQEKLTK